MADGPTFPYRKEVRSGPYSSHPDGKLPPLLQYTGYLPEHREIYLAFFADLTQQAAQLVGQDYSKPVQEFKQAIESNKILYDLVQEIFVQVDPQYQYEHSVKDWEDMLRKLDVILSGPPKFYIAKDNNQKPIGEPVGVPIYVMMDLLNNTLAGFDLFRNVDFNNAMRNLLNAWGEYLTTENSNKTLNTTDEGWFSKYSLAELQSKGRGVFTNNFIVRNEDPDKGYGFTSWDDFFVRRLKEGARPIHDLRDLPINYDVPRDIDPGLVIHHACESTAVRITENVRLHDKFWLKAQQYSLYDMLNRDPSAEEFVGGSVYQTFLSPQDYHRWHSPVDGTIVKAEVVNGAYYSALPDDGAPADEPGSNLKPGVPFGAYLRSQPWLTFVATRALIWIRAKDPRIGLLCFIGIGMAEVSTCDIKAAQDLVGKEVKTGQEIGMFHFGGSGHCLVFRRDAQIKFSFPELLADGAPDPSNASRQKIPAGSLPHIESSTGDDQPMERYKYIYGWHLRVNSIIGWSEAK
ncbi:hypothetical protein PQX77_011846 [Marasmius sp. AFHP31]|nr:hypothetical protein PQX77_011846 [Marasmius sp. AFHP31]